MTDMPEGYEPAENAAAKDVTMGALGASLDAQGIDPHDEYWPIDLIALADVAVEALLEAGATIPESMSSPFVPR